MPLPTPEAAIFGIDLLGIPLHPLVVHFPIVLAVLLPISALGALWAIRRPPTPRRVRALPVGGAVLVMAAAGLLPRTAGQGARHVAAAGAVGLPAMGVQVGHSAGARRGPLTGGIGRLISLLVD